MGKHPETGGSAAGKRGARKLRLPELELYAGEAPGRLRAIADDPDTPVKLRADIERFFFETVYGKSPQAIDLEGKVENTGQTVIRFEGELEKWSK